MSADLCAERAFDGGVILMKDCKVRPYGVADIVETLVATVFCGLCRLKTCSSEFLSVLFGSLLRLPQRPVHNVDNPIFLATPDNLQLFVDGQPKKSRQLFPVIEDLLDICAPRVRNIITRRLGCVGKCRLEKEKMNNYLDKFK